MSVYSVCLLCNNLSIRNGICENSECANSNQSLLNIVNDEFDVNTEYFLPSDFNTMRKQHDSNSLVTCLHFNCRSLKRNQDSLVSCLSTLDLGASIIGLSETWLQEGENITCPISHYNFVGRGRSNRRGGGVGLLVHENLKFKRRSDLEEFNDFIESVFIEISSSHHKVIVSTVYRPPNRSTQSFIDSFQPTLHKISHEGKECIIMGDFNVNLFCDNTSTHQFLDSLIASSLIPMIFKPTRVTEQTATLLDNIFVNRTENMVKTGIIITDVSDHLSPFILCNFDISNNESTHTQQRIIREENIIRFCSMLESIEWNDLKKYSTVDEKFKYFMVIFQELYNECFPFKRINLKKYTNSKTWFTKELKKKCKKKFLLYKKFLNHPTTSNKQLYKQYRNTVRNEIRKAKREYYHTLFDKVKNDLKGTWKIINTVLNKTKKKDKCEKLKKNNAIIDNKQQIADAFNEYFSSIGSDLVGKLPRYSGRKHATHFLKKKSIKSMFFTPVTQRDIINVVLSIKNKKSTGHDDIDSYVVKRCIHLITLPLSEIFNCSFEQGAFPKDFKVAKVIPVYKKGDNQQCSNYRPISILSVFSKIFEKLVYERLIQFLDKNNILYSKQFGFRKGYSTDMALIEFVNNISLAFEDKKIILGLFLDLSKAFDSIDHDILIQKMHFNGIRGKVLDWFKSYLADRQQYVSIENKNSLPKSINVGVPQGSVLGPLLFLIYVNDLCCVSDILNPITFADDTNLFLTGTDIHEMTESFNHELNKVYEWFLVNKLTINLEKTNFMVFRPHTVKIDINSVNITLNNQRIKGVQSTKFLGVTIDEHLSWKYHVNDIACKISKVVGVLYKLKDFLPLRILVNLYNTMILPHFSYCLTVWGKCAKYLVDRLFILQKRAIRMVTNSHFLSPTDNLFKKLNILKIQDLYFFR